MMPLNRQNMPIYIGIGVFFYVYRSRPTTGFRCSVNFLQEVFRFGFISYCGNSTLLTFFQISENSSVDMLIKMSC